MLTFAIDIDGVLANFTDAYAAAVSRRTGIVFPKASSEWPKSWYWDRDAGVSKEDEEATWYHDIIQSKTFWQRLEPVENAKPALKQLNQMAQRGDQVYFITNRMGQSVKLQTERWLYNHGINYPSVIVTSEKIPFLRALKANFFIDDKPETVIDVGNTAEKEKWENFNLFIFDMPYNRVQHYPNNVQRAGTVLEAIAQAYGRV
jgi:uncharacterized HAD superfamily protein